MHIPIDKILPNPEQPRTEFDPGEQWDMLKQVGEVPTFYQPVALATCKACVLYEDASPKTCRDCPAVELLRRLIDKR